MVQDLPETAVDEEGQDGRARSSRQYPPFYEKVVPIALGLIIVAIVILLLVIVGVALGLFSGAG